MWQKKCIRFAIYATVIVLLTSCTGPWHREPTATVVVHPDKPGPTVPERFLGLSLEARELTNPQLNAQNSSLVQMLSLLGPGVLRFGGNSVERTFWNTASPSTDKAQQYVVTRADLERVFGFARQVGWSVILGVNLHASTPDQAADEIAAAAAVGGPLLMAVEIGNEPDLYKPQWTPAQFSDAFNTFADAIHARVPHVAFIGPDSSWGHWLPSFIDTNGSRIDLATYHYYPLHRGAGLPEDAPTFPSVAHLLSPDMMNQTRYDIHKYAVAAQQAGLPLRIDETNSVSGGGERGVSDVFAAALWMAQYLFTAAEQGAAGVNVHGMLSATGKTYYTPLRAQTNDVLPSPGYIAEPPFYGMLLFHYGAVGQLVDTTLTGTNTLTGTDTLTVFAARAHDGTLHVTLINADESDEQFVDVQLGAVYKQSHMLQLQAPSLAAENDITFGKTGVRPDGTWPVQPVNAQYLNSEHVEVLVPATSAVVLTLTP